MNIIAEQKLRRSASKSAACKPLTLRIAEWYEGQDPQLWRKAAGGNNENAMSSASTVALKMNSSSRNARPQGNHAGSHPVPLFLCPNGHVTLPCSQCSSTQPRTPYLGIRHREIAGNLPLTALGVTARGATIQQT